MSSKNSRSCSNSPKSMKLFSSVLILLLYFVNTFTTAADRSVRILPEISVKIGQFVELFPSADIPVVSLRDDDYCILEVIRDDPLYSMVGTMSPSTFPCDFKQGTVVYSHNGAPPSLLKVDYVGLRLYQVPRNIKNTLPDVTNIVLPIRIIGDQSSFKFINFKQNLTVDKIKGTSNAISDDTVDFKLSPITLGKKFLSCIVSVNFLEESWPKYGKLVYSNAAGAQENVETILQSCSEFLNAGYRYEHYQPNSPKWDFVPIKIEVVDSSSGLGLQSERVFVPIYIAEACENTPPKFKTTNNPVIIVNNMNFKSLAINNIAAEDAETKKELLIYNISKPLESGMGQIMKRENEKHVPVSSFLEKDLEDFKIIYYPPGREINHNGEDYLFEVTVFDSEYLCSKPMSVQIQMSKYISNTPWASVNQELVVVEGQEATITEKSLKIVDRDSVADVTITVREPPSYGTLLINGRSNKMFSVADIAEGKLKYVHDGSDSTEDEITLALKDKTMNSNRVMFRIKILSVDDTKPKMLRVVSLNVNQWSTNALTSENLVAEDSECPNHILVYKITSPPKHGTVVKKFPFDITETSISEFTQSDLGKGLIFYRHQDDQTSDDSFEFEVEDCVGNRSPTSSIDIAVLPNFDKPPRPDQSATHRVTVRETQVKAITSNILGYTDADTKAENIIFRVLSALHFADSFEQEDAGQLILSDEEPERGKSYRDIDTFSQMDVEKGRLWYVPPKSDLGMKNREVHMLYEVDDSLIGEMSLTVLKTNALNISLVAIDDQPPSATIRTIEVEDSTFRIIDQTDIKITDVDSELKQVQMKMSDLPQHGLLMVGGRPADTEMWVNVTYLDKMKFRYDHDGSTSMTDRFSFQVRDGANNMRKYWVPINIFHISDHAPVQHEQLDTDLEVKEGGSIVISDHNLKVMDVDTPDERIMYLIVKYPDKGVIKNDGNLVVSNRFSQADVNAGRISYQHNQREIGVDAQIDSFQLMFTDQDLPRYDQSQHNRIDLKIRIRPDDNSAPLVITRELEVEEGGHCFLTSDALSVQDRDSPAESIGFVIVTQPEWGYLQRTMVPGEVIPKRLNMEDLPSFTYNDVKNMRLVYVQSKHKNVEPIADKIVVYATDGKQISDNYTMSIRIQPVSDENPQFEARNITVTENGFMVLDDIFLSARDLDKPADKLMFYIEEFPLHGYITNRNYSGSYRWLTRDDNIDSFNFEELSKRYISIWYYHDCTENMLDQFTVRLSDGAQSVRHVIYVQIVPINDEIPTVRHSGGVSVKRDQSARLSHFAIIADDVDTPNDQLYFLIRAMPQAGYFMRKQISRSGKEEWVKMDEHSTPFTQKDIDEGMIIYQHNSSMNKRITTDVFAYVVSDGINLSDDASFKISILDDDKSPINLVNNKLTLNSGSKAVITTEYLNADDYANRPSEIVFTIDDAPANGRIEEVKNPGVSIDRFTQAQVTNKEIRYVHILMRGNGVNRAHISDSFNFIVSNGQTWLNKTFMVTVKFSHQLPTLVENKPLQLRQGASKDITIANLHVLDPDTKSRNLTYIIMQKPAEGTLKNGNRTIEYTFTQFDIDNQDITYHHHGTDHIHDDFKFSISDGQNSMYFIKHEVTSKPITFQIDIMVPKPNQLQIKSTINRNLIVNDGHIGYRLDSGNIQVKGSDYEPDKIEFKIVRKPIFGELIYYESGLPVPVTFTYDELINKNIMYVIFPEKDATNDSFVFDVQDANGKFTQARRYDLSWASIEFKTDRLTVCEDGGSVGIRVVRYGWVGGKSQVEFKIKDIPSSMHDDDYFYNRQVVFDEMESEKEIKLEIRKSEELILNQNIKLIMRRPDNAVLGIRTKMDIEILDETDSQCIFGTRMPPSKTLPGSNQNPKPPKVNTDFPQLPPDDPVLGGGTKNPPWGPNEFVPPSAAPVLEVSGKPSGPYNPVDKEEARKLFQTLLPGGHNPNSNRDSDDQDDENTLPDGDFLGGNMMDQPQLKDDEPPLERRDCGPPQEGLMYYSRLTGELLECNGAEWVPKTFNSPPVPTNRKKVSGHVMEEPRKPACPKNWTDHYNTCYLLVKSSKTWVQAKDDCEGRDAQLVSVKFGDSQEQGVKWLITFSKVAKFWTGLHKMYSLDGDWVFTDGTKPPFSSIDWGKTSSDADDPDSANQCANVNKKGKFQTRPCQKPRYPFICQRPADVYTADYIRD
ncbi:FRAS1-related extracellular matrix protein 1-like isoform X3 [Convolutriloba macropyga]|uniref:FRAS1-related extracellular matrix protein 1-like isoform X3 n=1 Tax=Convolutriloba macropyga TaxID=536237 RepID=UPI003F51CE1E